MNKPVLPIEVAPTPPVDWTSIDTQIEHMGEKIVLPESPAPMEYDAAIQTLERVKAQEDQTYDVQELIQGAPWDAAVAVYRALQDVYGVVITESRMTFYGPMRPDLLTVVTGSGQKDRVQVPLGQMRLPNVSEPIQVILRPNGVVIAGVVRRRDRAIMVEIANRARDFMRTHSVYKGKAVRFNVDENGDLDISEQPEFIDLATVTEGDMIHTSETLGLIRTNIFAPLKNAAACRKHKIPLKRGILLSGRYGTGKSLTARITAKVATDNGWTFIMLNRAQGLAAAIEFARTYQPCVIFAEDIDRAADREDEDVNDLVNLLDGIISKDMEMMVVLTTNFVEKIDKSLLRPGRFDAVINIQAPDAETVAQLIRAYARDLLPKDVDLAEVSQMIVGAIPATIREVVERAKLSMLMEDRKRISAEDLHIAAAGMKHHMQLLEPPVAETGGAADQFAAALKTLVCEAVNGEMVEGEDTSAEVRTMGRQIARRVDGLDDRLGGIAIMAGAAAASSNRAAVNTDEMLNSSGLVRRGK